jgi:hypothetical protein
MATRSKTVEFVYQSNITSLAANTKRTFTGNTIYIPESSITFRSVTLVATWADDATAASNPTNWITGIKLGAASESTATVTDTYANSGEAWTYRIRRDITSYFTTNWSGTSMAWEASIQQAVSVTQNHVIKVIITYEYADTSSTHIKTIRIPIESTRSLMTTSYQTLGGATAIPAFKGSYLPEASVTIRQIWVELWGNTADVTTATDWISTARVGGSTTYDWYDNEAALLSGRWAYGICDITARTLTSAESLEIIVTGITNRLTQMGGMVCATYEFAPADSTTIYNSLFIGGVDSVSQMGGTAAGDEDDWQRTIYINEPTTITMKESGVALFFNDSVATTINVAVGSQTDTSYAFTAAGTQDGQYSVVHRIDAAGANGTAGMTLARGANLYDIQTRSATASAGWNLSGFLLLNYTSGKASDGVGVHAQTRYFHLADTAADANIRQVTNVAVPTIPESQYYLVGAMVDIDAITTGTATQALALLIERTSGRGWDPTYIGMYRADAETGFITPFGAARSIWQRWPGDPDDTKADIETSRSWRLDMVPAAWAAWGIWVTWHAHSWTVAGTVSDYADADGAGLTVNIHRAATGELVKTVTTTTGGVFTTPWFDDTEELYAVVYEDETHVGRSANTTATTGS